MDVEFRHLRAFAAVAELGSFTAASKQLLLTQPALTRTIQQLEARLEVTLLERTSRALNLTDAGRVFLARAQSMLHDLEAATAEARGRRELRIGFSWALPTPWAHDCAAAFENDTGAEAHIVRRDDIEAALARGEIDVALIRHTLPNLAVAELTLFEEKRVAAVSSRSPLASRAEISWNELSEHPVVINASTGNTRPELWPPEHRPVSTIECGNYDEWAALIAADRGVGATPQSAATTYVHPGVTFLPLVGAPSVPLRLAWLPHRSAPLVREFVETIIARPFTVG